MILHRVTAAEEGGHQLAHKTGGSADGQTIGDGAVVHTKVLHADGVIQPRSHTQQHAARMGGFCEEAMDRVSKDQFQAKGHAAGTASHAAGQIHKQRVLGIDGDFSRFQLLLQPQGCHGIAQKQRLGVFVIHEVAVGIAFRLLTALGNGNAVIGFVFNDFHAFAAEHVFFPLTGIGGHMHGYPESQCSAHDTNGQAQVAGRAHGNGVTGQQIPHLLRMENGIGVPVVQHTMLLGDGFRHSQHLVDTAPGLDRAGNRQVAIQLDPQFAGNLTGKILLQDLLHGGNLLDGGLQNTSGFPGLGKGLPEIVGKPGQPVAGIHHICHGERTVFFCFRKG